MNSQFGNNNKQNKGLPKLPPIPGVAKPPTPSNNTGLPSLPGINKPALPTPSLPTIKPIQPAPKQLPSTALPNIPKVPVEPAQMPIIQQPPVTPTYVPSEPTVTQSPVESVDASSFFKNAPTDEDIEETVSDKKGWLKRPDAKPRSQKKTRERKGVKNKKETNVNKHTLYSGQRKKVLYARIVVFSILGILIIAGLNSFLPKASGLTGGDSQRILSQVRENLNVTDFPRVEGEGIALNFTQKYLNYNPETVRERTEALRKYVPENILGNIDLKLPSEEQLAKLNESSANSEAAPIERSTVSQVVTDGPYLVGTKMFKGGNAALYTTMTQVNNNTWIYLQVPLYYDNNNGGISVSGSPTFMPPIQSTDVPEWENSSNWTADPEIDKAIKADVVNYMEAWTESKSATINRFLTKDGQTITATPFAQQGLDGKVKFISLNSFIAEQKPRPEEGASAEELTEFRTRNAEINVTLMEPTSGLVYTQTYRLVIRYVNDNWFIEDIQNPSGLIDRDDAIEKRDKKNAEATK